MSEPFAGWILLFLSTKADLTKKKDQVSRLILSENSATCPPVIEYQLYQVIYKSRTGASLSTSQQRSAQRTPRQSC